MEALPDDHNNEKAKKKFHFKKNLNVVPPIEWILKSQEKTIYEHNPRSKDNVDHEQQEESVMEKWKVTWHGR